MTKLIFLQTTVGENSLLLKDIKPENGVKFIVKDFFCLKFTSSKAVTREMILHDPWIDGDIKISNMNNGKNLFDTIIIYSLKEERDFSSHQGLFFHIRDMDNSDRVQLQDSIQLYFDEK